MVVFRIKEIRIKNNMSQNKLSKYAKISREYLYNIENNKNTNVSLNVLINIAYTLNVNVKDLFFTTFDIENLKKEMYYRIDAYGIESKEAIEVSQLIDLLINVKMNKDKFSSS